jgi:hypothetical protein
MVSIIPTSIYDMLDCDLTKIYHIDYNNYDVMIRIKDRGHIDV